jgi:hypothetical protein
MARYAFAAFIELSGTTGIRHLGYARMGDAPAVQAAASAAAESS